MRDALGHPCRHDEIVASWMVTLAHCELQGKSRLIVAATERAARMLETGEKNPMR
jgi:hypothetical protein